MPRRFCVGLTGGICSGKTVVANIFAKLQVQVIDADIISRQLVEPGTDAFAKIIAHFGEKFLTQAGKLDRSKLRQHIFADKQQRIWLQELLHPLIREKMQHQVHKANSQYCILVIPLLAEAGSHPLVDRVLVVDVPESLQLSRLQQRDGISLLQAQLILQAQASRSQRLQLADDVIDNDKDLQSLQVKVESLHNIYLDLSKKWQEL